MIIILNITTSDSDFLCFYLSRRAEVEVIVAPRAAKVGRPLRRTTPDADPASAETYPDGSKIA